MTRRLRPTSIRFRLTLWYAGVLALVLLGYAAGVWSWVRHEGLDQLDDKLHEDFEVIGPLLALTSDGGVRLADDDEQEDLERLPWFEVRRGDGSLALRQSVATQAELATREAAAAHPRFGPASHVLANGISVRTMRRPFRVGEHEIVVEAARSQERLDDELAELGLVLLLGVPLGVALAAAGGLFLARRALAPVARLTERARELTAERLTERLPVAHPDDELGRLAAAFNEMLARLERSFEQLRRFTADASHELRTPLTALRSVGEVALRSAPSPEEQREVIGSMLEEVDRLTRLVDDLLLLARGDAGHLRPRRERCDLAALAREIADRLLVLAEEKRQSLRVDAAVAVEVCGDPVLLRQALQNLLDNAIEHGPEGSEIQVAVARGDGAAIAEVVDHGPGVPAEHRERIFERFYRVDPARSRTRGGAGLGLAIARWIAQAHGGRIELSDTAGGGATFRVRLPLAGTKDGGMP